MFGVIYGAPSAEPDTLLDVARAFSPRVECLSRREIVLDLSGLTRLFGDARELADEMRRTAASRGVQVRVAVASTRTAARLVAHHRAGVTTIVPGHEASAVASLPIEALAGVWRPEAHAASDPGDLVRTVTRWGLRTLGALAALPVDDVAARLGQVGVSLHRAARGEDPRPLVPDVPEEPFEETVDLEWPIEGLEPLSFVLGRLLEPLAAHLERRDRGAAVLRVRLHLVTRDLHERVLQLPFPLRDARALRTLILLDLDSHPPTAAIDRVTVAVDPTPARVVQYSLLARPLPSPDQIATLMARLQALMGETRCGSPALVDSWEPGAFAMKSFTPASARPFEGAALRRGKFESVEQHEEGGACGPVLALRRFRTPVPVRVRVEAGAPVRVTTDVRGLPGGRVDAAAGPWRTSGRWWMDGRGFDRDEWDVTLADATCRIFRARDTETWFMEAMVD